MDDAYASDGTPSSRTVSPLESSKDITGYTGPAFKALSALTNHDSVKWDFEVTDSCSKRTRASIKKHIESAVMQALVTLLIVVDLILTVIGLFLEKETDAVSLQHKVFNVLSTFVILALCLDLSLRIVADGSKFCKSYFNIFETVIMAMCVALYFVESTAPVSVGRTFRPMFRVAKALRLGAKAALGKGRIGARFDRLVDGIAENMVVVLLGDILKLPPDNVHLKASRGFMSVDKAMVNTEAFKDLQLPFTITGGFMELVHIDMNLHGRKRFQTMASHIMGRETEQSEDDGVIIIVKNVLLILGPGHHQVPPKPPWTYDRVLDCKARLVELLARRTEAFSVKPRSAEENPAAAKKGVGDKFVHKLKKQTVEALFSKVNVDIQGLVLRFEDPDGELGQRMIFGAKIGSWSIGLLGADQWRNKKTNSDTADLAELDAFRAKGQWREMSKNKKPFHHSRQSFAAPSPGHGEVRLFCYMTRLSLFWDVDPTGQFYTTLLEKRETAAAAVRHFRVANSLERMRLCAYRALESNSKMSTGHLLMLHSLRETCSMHHFLLKPFSVSIHTMLRRHNQAFEHHWPPAQDVDVLIQALNFDVSMVQARSFRRLMKFLQNWQHENELYRWHFLKTPPSVLNLLIADRNPDESTRRAAKDKWCCAVGQLMLRIDKSEPWKLKSYLRTWREAHYRTIYIDLLQRRRRFAQEKRKNHKGIKTSSAETAKNDHHRAVLWDADLERYFDQVQVALPLEDIMFYRYVVLQMEAEKAAREAREKEASESKTRVFTDDTENSSSSDYAADEDPHPQEVRIVLDAEDSGTASESLGGGFTKNAAECSSQLTVRLETIQSCLLSSPVKMATCRTQPLHLRKSRTTANGFSVEFTDRDSRARKTLGKHVVRKQILRAEVHNISLVCCASAPESLISLDGSERANHHQHALKDELAKGNGRINFDVGQCRLFYVSAPIAAPTLRMIFNRSPEPVGGPQCTAHASSSSSSPEMRHTALRVFVVREPEISSADSDAGQQRWQCICSVWACPLEITLYAPLWYQLCDFIEDSLEGVQSADEQLGNDLDLVDVKEQLLNKPQRRRRQYHTSQQRRFEQLCGMKSSALADRWCATIHSGGVRASFIEPLSPWFWLQRKLVVPPGAHEVLRQVRPPVFSLGPPGHSGGSRGSSFGAAPGRAAEGGVDIETEPAVDSPTMVEHQIPPVATPSMVEHQIPAEVPHTKPKTVKTSSVCLFPVFGPSCRFSPCCADEKGDAIERIQPLPSQTVFPAVPSPRDGSDEGTALEGSARDAGTFFEGLAGFMTCDVVRGEVLGLPPPKEVLQDVAHGTQADRLTVETVLHHMTSLRPESKR